MEYQHRARNHQSGTRQHQPGTCQGVFGKVLRPRRLPGALTALAPIAHRAPTADAEQLSGSPSGAARQQRAAWLYGIRPRCGIPADSRQGRCKLWRTGAVSRPICDRGSCDGSGPMSEGDE